MYPVKASKLTVTSAFGPRTYTYQGRKISDYHKGIDLIGGSEIVAFDDGVVTATCNSGVQYGQACYVRIKHSSGWQTLYYHLKSGSVCVSVGQTVKRGQKLGIMGATGQATGVHLHFQIDKGSSATAINPYDYVFNGKELGGSSSSSKKSNEEVAREVIRGDWGNGDERKRRLSEAGYDYSSVQSIVNQILSGNAPKPTPKKINEELANEVINGNWGNGDERKRRLTEAGYDYSAIQSIVNQKLGSKPAKQTVYHIVVRGDTLWGIAKRYYGNGNRYPEIAKANNIANPDIIHVGQKLLIP